ncbi:thioredoxin family protein [bacterium LRH843]|nr:thioredoxin family protein [bacterium LRH843]
MGLNKWFDKGITPDTYIEQLKDHKESFLHIYNTFTLPDDEDLFQAFQEKNLRIIVLAEVWCGHCMLNIPVLLHLAEKTNMPVRILARDQNLELMDQYLTNGKSRTIPIFIFIDEDGNEVAKWGPIAEKTKQFVDKYRAELPSKEAEDYQEKFTAMITLVATSFRENSEFWYGSYESMKQTLTDMLQTK